MTLTINQQRCPAQKELCKAIPSCSNGRIAYIDDGKEPLGGKIVIDEAICNERVISVGSSRLGHSLMG